MTRVLHATRISNVDSSLFLNRIRKIVILSSTKEIEKDVFHLVMSVGKTKQKKQKREKKL